MTASVSASAARSRSSKKGASRQAATANSRRLDSPSASASRLCMSTQNAQPLIIDARSFTSSSTVRSTFVWTYFSNPMTALYACGATSAGFIRCTTTS